MKKYRSVILLTSVLIFGLTACQKKDAGTIPEASAAVSEAETSATEASSDDSGQTPDSDQTSDSDLGADHDQAVASGQPAPLSLALRTTYLSEHQDNIQLCNTRFDTISIASQDHDRYPALSEALQKHYSEKLAEASHKIHTQNAELAARDYADHPDHFWGPYTSEVSLQVRRADNAAVSLLKQDVEYTGGAHPISFYSGTTFDTESSQPLKLTDVVTDVSVLPEILESILKAKYPGVSFFDLKNDLKSASEQDGSGFSWTLDYQGITFYFSPYELASYADGLLTATIPFAARPELIQESYTQVPETYTVFFHPWQPLNYDLDDDGDMEEITVSGNPDEYGTVTQLQIRIDDRTFHFDTYAFSLDPCLVHTRDGRDYLYVKSSSDNDYECLLVYDLEGDDVSAVGSMDGTGFYGIPGSGNSSVTELPANPDSFTLSTRLNMLSTTTGKRTYRIGTDGMPEPKEAYYQISADITLTAKKDLSAAMIDPDNGKVLDSQFIVPKGEKLRLYHTDNQTYMDMILDDGRVCRFQTDASDWPQTVNGQSSLDCFDGMQFAG